MRALLLIDIQNDFVPGGALAVADGDAVIPIANALQPRYELVVATQDWHPADHGSFAVNHPGRSPGELIELNGLTQVLWPAHCVQHTRGAEFCAELDTSRVARVFPKGTDPTIDSYSGFFDNGQRRATGLAEFLRARGVREVDIIGLATDYCVKFTALDALHLGFETRVFKDGCRGVNLSEGDCDRAFAELRSAGATLIERVDLPPAAPSAINPRAPERGHS
jgi:nicotinamidase/pyrazinamidase